MDFTNMSFMIICEDDVIIQKHELERIQMEIELFAPPDWDVIQLDVNNKLVREQFVSIREPFIRWMPEYYGSAIVAVSGRGSKKLIIKDQVYIL